MKVEINGEPIIIKFAYGEELPAARAPKTGKVYKQRESIAYLKRPGADPHATVKVLNSPRIPFSFANGRKWVFAKLLKELKVDRAQRAELWNELFTQCPNTVSWRAFRSEVIKKVEA
jgi:hypothetical protein